MSELNLILNLEGENKSIIINSKSSVKEFFSEIRKQFSLNFPNVNKHKIIFFNGIPPKKLREIDLEENKTLEEMKVYSNSILRISIDEENQIKEIELNQEKKEISTEKIKENSKNKFKINQMNLLLFMERIKFFVK